MAGFIIGEGLIKHWESDICAFEKGIQQALKRLGK